MQFLTVERTVCLSWASSYIMAQLLTAVAAATVSVVNKFLNFAISKLVEYERHNSASEVCRRCLCELVGSAEEKGVGQGRVG
jgi:hypothetical protein